MAAGRGVVSRSARGTCERILVAGMLVAAGWQGEAARGQRFDEPEARGLQASVVATAFIDDDAFAASGMRSVVIAAEPAYEEPHRPVGDDGTAFYSSSEFQPEPLRCTAGSHIGCPSCTQAVYPHGGFCHTDGHACRAGINASCEPIGLWQRLHALDAHHGICHTLRADSLILWRNAPPARQLFTTAGGLPAFASDQLESTATAGGRLSYFRRNRCGEAWETTYLYGGRFTATNGLPSAADPLAGFVTAPPGIFGVNRTEPGQAVGQVDAILQASIQSAEINRRWALGPAAQFLTGFRWLQWFETAAISDTFGAGLPGGGQDFFETAAVNNLWGGQIGIDTLLFRTRSGFRTEGIVKAGAYANNAGQTSAYRNLVGGVEVFSNSTRVREWPASAAFVGEVGLTGVVPLDPNWDFRFGYLGLWLTGLAQPTNQLAGQNLAPSAAATTGTLDVSGTAIVQGVTLGLEGRW
jgi:hypothetical protein